MQRGRRSLVAVAVSACMTCLAEETVRSIDGWELMTWNSGAWVASDRAPESADGAVVFARSGKQECIAKTFDIDLSVTPCLETVTAPSNCHWRLTATLEGQGELLLADCQVAGRCCRNVAQRLDATGSRRVLVRLAMWGWGGSDRQRLVLKRAAFVVPDDEADARELGGVMVERHHAAMKRARTIECSKHEHPSLRYRIAQKPELLRKARTTHAMFAKSLIDIVDNLATEKAKPAYKLEGDLLTKTSHAWREGLLQLHPPDPPQFKQDAGARIFSGARPESTWRVLCWHDFSRWLIGSALTDDPAFAEQAKRWILAMARWRFWQHPEYIYFDFATAYALQNFAFGYDIAHTIMSDPERAEVRQAIAQLARGLYLNTLCGHGSIYNDLRGNHTAVTICGLGLAGLVLLQEHPEAAQWTALAEQFMIDCFEEHTSGAWTESPSYGQYGIDEWLKLAEALRNVTGRDHMKHPFFTRYADFSLMIHDWEGRNLGYNGGGWASRWNHWVFFRIAAELRRPDVQWLANFCLEGVDEFSGYGDAFWWVDPTLEAQRPTATNVGQHFADIGLSVWRTGWEDAPTVLLHHCGRKGQHKEENMNHITLYVKGERILSDGVGGRTTDHNVPVIAGRKQNMWGPGETLAFHSDERSGYALGDATRAYGPKTLRHVLYLRSGALVVVDDLRFGAGHPVEIAFSLHPHGETRPLGNGFRVDDGGVALVGAFSDGQGQALSPTVTPRAKSGNATHDVSVTQTSRQDTRTITVLRFGTSDTFPGGPMMVTPYGSHVDFSVGSEIVRVGTAPGIVGPSVSSTGPLWIARLVAGNPVDVLAVGSEPGDAVEIHAYGQSSRGNGCVSWATEPKQ